MFCSNGLLTLHHRGQQKKPHSAVTVQIERLTSEQYDENDVGGIVDLIEVIRLQASGPGEAARAIRKKLKYGNLHRQLRALTILDGLIQNAGPRFQRVFADEPLLERLRIAATDPVSDGAVRAKCQALFGQWTAEYKSTAGMEGIVALYSQLPQRKKPATARQSKVLRETQREAEGEGDAGSRYAYSASISAGGRPAKALTTPRAAASSTLARAAEAERVGSFGLLSKRSKEAGRGGGLGGSGKGVDVDKEAGQLLETLATASVASTNLINALKLTNRERQRVSDDAQVAEGFEKCKQLRRKILRYIQVVESEQWLGGLIHANEELVAALMAYEVLDKSVEDDSDSEATSPSPERAFVGLRLGAAPPRPSNESKGKRGEWGRAKAETEAEAETEAKAEDDEDPFTDRHALQADTR
ncbi:MAG: putative actin patch assembly and actin polymerization protein [Trizodia sp. TS-e1964]|nr:MAG: putative actin patch assembly and actin polymerization protein [Trizodia sp. TS-e1964]